MQKTLALVFLLTASMTGSAQTWGGAVARLWQAKNYVLMRSSSYDRTGGNADFRKLPAGGTLTLLNVKGPGMVSHIWMTIGDFEPFYLKKLVLKIYWDNERTPSVEAPVGDFFGLGLGEYVEYQSALLMVSPAKALNCFFPMPFAKRARIVVTNEGERPVDAFYYNIDYREYRKTLPAGALYFHAQYRQCAPCVPVASNGKNHTGAMNYVWMTATGRGQFVGVTMSVVENSVGWWGEGDDMFFIDGGRRIGGEIQPQINGTGTEDYFLGAWDFGGKAFAYQLFGAPVVGREIRGSKWSVYRFHLDSPITFTKSFRATIEHGTANNRGDYYYSVAYWYQTEPHAPFPPLPPVRERIPPQLSPSY